MHSFYLMPGRYANSKIGKKGKTMHILVTNDDGVTAPGLLALAQAMRQFGKVEVPQRAFLDVLKLD